MHFLQFFTQNFAFMIPERRIYIQLFNIINLNDHNCEHAKMSKLVSSSKLKERMKKSKNPFHSFLRLKRVLGSSVDEGQHPLIVAL